MNKGAKILVTAFVFIIFIVIFGAISGASHDAGHSTPGILGIIVFAGLIGAIKAIWKKDDSNDKKNDDNDSSILQK